MTFFVSPSLKVSGVITFFFLSLFFAALLSRVEAGEGIDGKALYTRWCAQCHGFEGKGDGLNATSDMITPQDHTDAIFMSTRTDEHLKDSIWGGGTMVGKSPMMPFWRMTLADDEIGALVDYLRVLCKCSYDGVLSDEKLRKVMPDFR